VESQYPHLRRPPEEPHRTAVAALLAHHPQRQPPLGHLLCPPEAVSTGTPALPPLAVSILDNIRPPAVPPQVVPLPVLLGNEEPTAQ
jgi:hypothetical protein